MGVSVNNAKRKRKMRSTEAALKRALWDYMEIRTDYRLESSAAYDIISKVFGCMKWICEDLNTLAEFKHIGITHRHWYDIVMHIGEDRVTAQNILDEADTSPPHPPTRAQLWLGMLLETCRLLI
jgi:hypothetical protein